MQEVLLRLTTEPDYSIALSKFTYEHITKDIAYIMNTEPDDDSRPDILLAMVVFVAAFRNLLAND